MDIELEQKLQKLLSGIAAGDARAFRQLYEATSSRLYGVALRILRGHASADDVLQDAYVQVWHRAGDYARDRGSVSVWLTSIVRYRAIDALRKRRPDTPFDETQFATSGVDLDGLASDDLEFDAADDASGPLRSAITADDSRYLKRCLSRLSEAQKRSITLAFFYGMTHAELADSLAQPLGTIKSRLRRSLKRLKECLAELGFKNEISSGTG